MNTITSKTVCSLAIVSACVIGYGLISRFFLAWECSQLVYATDGCAAKFSARWQDIAERSSTLSCRAESGPRAGIPFGEEFLQPDAAGEIAAGYAQKL